jgi:aryl-alcohol dehydrogenase-like predicted oxidoreductase
VDTRRIGSLEASVVGLGCNNFGTRLDAAATANVVHAALDAGVTFLDTAELYGDGLSEEYIGRALGDRRDRAVIATKFGYKKGHPARAGQPENVRRAVEESLRRLRTDRIDLYQIHSPDPRTPIADTLAALDELVRAGKVREIGCSNFSVEQLRDAEDAVKGGAPRFVSVQNQYSLMHREPEDGVLDECRRQGLAFLPYYPLASGLLTGKYRLGRPAPGGTRIAEGSEKLREDNLRVVEALVAFAEGRGHTVLELAFAWLLAHRAVASVIAGATRPEQVRANAVAAAWRLAPEERAEVDAVVAGAAQAA